MMWPFCRKRLDILDKLATFRLKQEQSGPHSLLIAVLPTETACEIAHDIKEAKVPCLLEQVTPLAALDIRNRYIVGEHDLVVSAKAVEPGENL